jgi:hypothetical protein
VTSTTTPSCNLHLYAVIGNTRTQKEYPTPTDLIFSSFIVE